MSTITTEDVVDAGIRTLEQLEDQDQPYRFDNYATCTVGHLRLACGDDAELYERLVDAVIAGSTTERGVLTLSLQARETRVSHLTFAVEQEMFETTDQGTDEHKREAARVLVERAIVGLALERWIDGKPDLALV